MANKSQNLTGIDAAVYSRIANRISLPQSQETANRQIDDAYQNIQKELKKEGHTGKLTSPDGLIHFDPVPYKGFVIQLYGQIVFMNRFEIYGKLMTIGTATGKVINQGREVEITFDIETSFPNGIENTEDAMKFLIGLINSVRSHRDHHNFKIPKL